MIGSERRVELSHDKQLNTGQNQLNNFLSHTIDTDNKFFRIIITEKWEIK